jgi:soluble lytic murein transglycosylase-like protein
VLAALLVAAGATLVWQFRDRIRSAKDLYGEAQAAAPRRAAQLYDLLAQRAPAIEEYWRLWAAEKRLPAYDAVAALNEVARYRPDSPAAYEAHLALARYYARIESPDTVAQYKAALALDNTVAVRLELARYLEEQQALPEAYQQYLLMLGRDRPDAVSDLRRTGPDALTIARDLLSRQYCRDVLDVLRGIRGVEVPCLRAEAYRCLGQEKEAAVEQQACLETSQDKAGSSSQGAGETKPESAEQVLLASNDPTDWWKATWDIDAQGRITEVIPIYLQIAQRNAPFADDAAYRALVLARRANDAPSATEALSLLQSRRPSWLAWRATGDLGLQPAPSFPDAALDLLNAEVLHKVAALESLGREDLAFQELRFTGRVSETPEVLYQMAQELARRGHIAPAYSLTAAYLVDHPFASLEFWQLAYPRAYEAEVTSRAEAYHVPPELVWAVMRQESAFAPEAVSSAGARGLMQVMPGTFAEMNELLKGGYAPGDAFLPGPNIDACARYLAQLLEHYQGDADLAIMAYNAGPGNVDTWRDLPVGKDRDDLLRFVPYGETREYLERVSLDALLYQELYR